MLIVIILFLTISVTSIYAQKPPEHQMKIYQAPSGKIYVNLNQPLYIKVSKSPDRQSKKYLLHSKTTPGIVNPFYFSHEGANVIFTPWAIDTVTKKQLYPKQNVDFIVYADGSAPVTKIRLDKTPVKYGSGNYFGGKVSVDFKVFDKWSGVEATYLSVNTGKYKKFDAPLVIDKQGRYSIKYYSVDNVGNVEKLKDYSFVLDNSPPVNGLEIQGPYLRNILSPKARILLHATDSVSAVKKIFYAFDYSDTLSYSAAIPVARLYDGKHKLVFYSVDIVGNRSALDSFNFFLDKTPPLVTDDIIGASYFVGGKQFLSGTSKLKLTAIDNLSGVRSVFYSINNEPWKEYESPIPLPKTHDLITVKYYAVDSVGNKSAVDESLSQSNGVFATYLDLIPPELSYDFTGSYKYGDTVYLGKMSKVRIHARDSQSGIKIVSYQIDSSAPVEYEKPFALEEPGLHKITVTAFDNVSNFSIIDFSVKVDTTAPEITIYFSQPPRISDGKRLYPATVKVFIVSQDNMTGVKTLYYTLNNQPAVMYKSYLSNLKVGKNVLRVVSTDYLGNKNVREFVFWISKN